MAAEAPPPAADEPKPAVPPAAPPAEPPVTPPTPGGPPAKAENPMASVYVVGAMVALLGVLALILWRMQQPKPTPGPEPDPKPPVVVPDDVGKLQAALTKINTELAAAKTKIAAHATELAERDASVAHWQVLFKESCDKVAKLKEELEALKNVPQTEVKQGLPTKQSRVLDELPPELPPKET